MRKIILLSFLLVSPSLFAQSSTQVLVGGVNLWPPKGPHCDRFVRCCDKAKIIDNDTDLYCKLRAAQNNLNCYSSLDDLSSYMRERGKEPPAECIKVKLQ